jgi:hypothetical protein
VAPHLNGTALLVSLDIRTVAPPTEALPVLEHPSRKWGHVQHTCSLTTSASLPKVLGKCKGRTQDVYSGCVAVSG